MRKLTSRFPFLFLGLFLIGLASAEDADLDSRLDREHARLSSDDAAVRDAAMEAIVKEGRPAAAQVRKLLGAEKDAEVAARLSRALEQIELNDLTRDSWRVVWTAEPMEDPPTAVAISPDGRWIATCGEFRLRVADTASLRTKWEADLSDNVSGGSVAFSADGEILFIAMDLDSAPRAWKTGSGEELTGFERCEGCGKYRVWTGPGGACAVLRADAWSRGLLAVSDGKRFVANSEVPVSGDGRLFLAGLAPDELTFFVLDPSKVVESAAHPISLENGAKWFPVVVPNEDFSECAVISHSNCEMLDLESGKKVRTLTLEVDSVAAIPGGWVTASEAGVLTWWKNGVATRRVECGEGEDISLRAVGGLLVVTIRPDDREAPGLVQLRSAETGALLREARDAGVLGPWGDVLVFVEDRAAVFFAGDKPIREFVLPASESRSHGDFAGGGGIVVVPGTRDLLMARKDRPDATVQVPNIPQIVNSVRWTPRGLVAESMSQIALFNEVGKALHRVDGPLGETEGGVFDPTELGLEPMTGVWSTPDGAIAAWEENSDVRVSVRRDGHEERFLLNLDAVDVAGERVGNTLVALNISDDGRRLAVIGQSRKGVEVWDLSTRKQRYRIELADTGQIYGLRFFADGESLAYYSEKADLVWNSEGERIAGLPDSLKYLPQDGRWLCWNGEDGLHQRDMLRGGVETTYASPAGADLSLVVLASEDSNRFLALGSIDARGLWKLDRRDRSATLVANGDGMRGCVLLAGDLPAFMTDEGVTFLRPSTWEFWTTREDLQGLTIEAAPGGRRFAIISDRRITVYEKR